jgi:hypothetical protein
VACTSPVRRSPSRIDLDGHSHIGELRVRAAANGDRQHLAADRAARSLEQISQRAFDPATENRSCRSPSSRNQQSITFGKDECHVMYLLRQKILTVLLDLENIHGRDREYDRFSRRSREESQLQAEPDQDNCNNSDGVMHAHNGSPVANALNAGGFRDTNRHQLPNAILCLPTAAAADY